MQLPNNEVGISDILQYQDCGRRFEFGMRRWSENGEPPEATGPSNAYGSTIHEAIALSEDGHADEDAIARAFAKYGRWLDPTDLAQLKEDLAIYHHRDVPWVKTVASEENLRVPLMEHEGETIFYRFKLDRLYERLQAPGQFVHVDYKSSRHARSDEEVHEDKQLWSYNWAIHEYWPEVETLVQIYDQLRYGQIPTRKSPSQREEMKEWLQTSVLAILEDPAPQPTWNEWCPWCPIMESCPVIDELSEYAVAEISAMAPEEKIERKTVVKLDPELMDRYVDQLPKVSRAKQVLERFETTVRDVLKQMPEDRRRAYGYELSERRNDVWTAGALQAAHEQLGEDFFHLIRMTKSAIESFYGKDSEEGARLIDLAQKQIGAMSLRKAR